MSVFSDKHIICPTCGAIVKLSAPERVPGGGFRRTIAEHVRRNPNRRCPQSGKESK